MQSLLVNRFFRSRYFIAAVAGLAWTGAFPDISIAGLAWVAPALLVAATLGKPAPDTFRIGYVGGLVHYLSMLYWLLLIPYRWHGIPLAPAVGWLALAAFLALFPAAWVWLIHSRQGQAAELAGPPASGALSPHWIGRALWAVSGAAVWVALEMFLARVLGGFPWDLLGVSQLPLVPLIQVCSLTGVYGVSFLVVWLSLSLLCAGLSIIRRPGRGSIWVGEVFLPVLAVAMVFNLGLREIRHQPAPARTVKALLVQPSIPQTVIWNADQDSHRFEELVRWSDQLLNDHPSDLMIWPESAVPKMLRYDTNTFAAVTGLAQRHHVWLIVGSDDAELLAGSANPDEAEYFNSSFLIGPAGELRERYIKRNLVVFGEYLPFQHWLPFLKWFTPISGGFTPGTHAVQFHLDSLAVWTAVLICFEDVFPQLGRNDVQPHTDFLVNITNDGWFGRGAAQWQQAASAALRAVENRVPLVRCTNNGLTCWIDADGRIRDILRDARGTIYGPGFLSVELPLPAPGEPHALAFYTRHGDWFGWACVGVALCVVLAKIVRASQRKRQTPTAQPPSPA